MRLGRILLGSVLLLASCSADDADSDPEENAAPDRVRFCDAYLGYLADPTREQLIVLAESADDDLAAVVEGAGAALDEAARDRCQAEWTAAAQGAGTTSAAAGAFLDALVAGDRAGAQYIAAANAIVVFEPWTPRAGELETVGGDTFVVVVDATRFDCQVETGVVLACTQLP